MAHSSEHLEKHPYINFEVPAPTHDLSVKLGEAYSKCQHLQGTALPPMVAAGIARMSLIKGVQGTAAIEGNTLNEQEIGDVVDGISDLPQSQKYLEREIENIVTVVNGIFEESASCDKWRVSPEWLQDINAKLLDGTDLKPHVVPGQYTLDQLAVGQSYRPPHPRFIERLVVDLCEWLNLMISVSQDTDRTPVTRFEHAFYAATLGHLYVAWVHPFGDGNGRTARALETAIFAQTGLVPWVSCSLLSDHYNRTRTRYYDQLAATSRNNEVLQYMTYAAEGFVDLLREQIKNVQSVQRQHAWINFVHEIFRDETQGETSKRRRELLLSLPEGKPTKRAEMRKLTPDLAVLYAGKSDRVLGHDLGRPKGLGLVVETEGGYVPMVSLMDGFMPQINGQMRVYYQVPPKTELT